MAGIADMIIQGAQQTAQTAGPDIAGGIQKGAALAAQVEEIQQNRQKLEMAKQQQQVSKIEKIGELYQGATKMEPGTGRNFMLKQAIPNSIKALGLEDVFPDSTKAFLESEPVAVPFLKAKIENGELDLPAVIQTLQDKSGEGLMKLVPEMQQFGAAQEIRTQASEGLTTLSKANETRIKLNEAAKRAAAAVAPREQQAAARITDQAATAVDRIHKAVKPLVINGQAVGKGLHILDTPNVPWKRLNEVAQDFSKALVGNGPVSDAKLHALETPSFQQNFADLVSKATADPDQPAAPAMVAYWKKFGLDLHNIQQAQVNEIAATYASTAETVYKGSNPKAYTAVKQVVDEYKKGKWSGVTPKKAFKDLTPEAQAIVVKKAMEKSGKDEATVRKELGAQ